MDQNTLQSKLIDKFKHRKAPELIGASCLSLAMKLGFSESPQTLISHNVTCLSLEEVARMYSDAGQNCA